MVYTCNFSIIIPHYNSLDTLPRTINSVPIRDDVEVLVVDNSPIPVRKQQIEGAIRDYTLLYSDNTKGAGHARNVGLEHAKGKWLIFADADDFFTEDFNNVLNKYKDTDWDVVMFPIKMLDSITLQPCNKGGYYNRNLQDSTKSTRRIFAENISPWSKLVKRQFVLDKGIRFGETKVSNDALFNGLIAVNAQKMEIDRSCSIYVLTFKNGSLTTRHDDESLLIRINVFVERYNIYRQYGYNEWSFGVLPIKYISNLNTLSSFINAIGLLLRNGYVFNGSFMQILSNIRIIVMMFVRLLRPSRLWGTKC